MLIYSHTFLYCVNVFETSVSNVAFIHFQMKFKGSYIQATFVLQNEQPVFWMQA